LPYLFVFERFKELNIPNTTNDWEGSFAALKKWLNNHNGLTLERKPFVSVSGWRLLPLIFC
jgi:hypothetical protein